MPIKKSAIKKILKKAGAVKISNDAIIELTEAVNEYAYSIAQKAVSLAKHAKRKTIKKEDIELANN